MRIERRQDGLHLAKVETCLDLSSGDVLTRDAAGPLPLDEKLHDGVMLEDLGQGLGGPGR
jgi:hypothetical protein